MSRTESWLQAHPKEVGRVATMFTWGISLFLAAFVACVDTVWHLENATQLISTLIQALGTVLAIVFSITIFGVDTDDSRYPVVIKNIHFYSWTYYVTVFLFFTAILVDVTVQLLGDQTPPSEELRAALVVFAISFSVLTLFWVPLYSLYVARWRSPSDKLELWFKMQPAVEAQDPEEALDIIETLANAALAGITNDHKSTAREASERLRETLEAIRQKATVSNELYEETAEYIGKIAAAAREAEMPELYKRISSLFILLFAWAIEAANQNALRYLLGKYTKLIHDSYQMEFGTYQLPVYCHLREAIMEIDTDQLDNNEIILLSQLVAAGERVMQHFRGATTPYERSRVVEEFLDFCYEVHRLLIFSVDPPEGSAWDLLRPNNPLEYVLDRLLQALVNGIYELIELHSDAGTESSLMPAETNLSIFNSILTESRSNWDSVHEIRMNVFYLEAAHLLEQTGVVELESCVSEIGKQEYEFESMLSAIEKLRQSDQERQFFTGSPRVELDEIMDFNDWLDRLEKSIEVKIEQIQ